ncbi:hypothetical protein [Ralstonia syzygii]|uniref:hypothetical protein n=1 Tax=Ralstonia syzygii TaxID=28097 RepID=UPI00351155EA
MTNPHPTIRDAKRQAFLASLAVLGNVTAAALAASVDRVTAYRWRESDEAFAVAWDDAIEQAADLIELEARRRAVEGVDEPVVYQGNFTYLYREAKDADGNPIIDELTQSPKMEPVLDEHGNHKVAAIRKYSDALMALLLKAHKPEKYRENSKVELAGRLAVSDMTEDEILAELAALVAAGVVPIEDDGCDLV